MILNSFIEELRGANEASSEYDAKLALVLEWAKKKRFERTTGRDTDESGNAGDARGMIPPFTSSIDAARKFCEGLCPDEELACSWEPGEASGSVGRVIEVAKTPAIALCLAAMSFHSQSMDVN